MSIEAIAGVLTGTLIVVTLALIRLYISLGRDIRDHDRSARDFDQHLRQQ